MHYVTSLYAIIIGLKYDRFDLCKLCDVIVCFKFNYCFYVGCEVLLKSSIAYQYQVLHTAIAALMGP